jgi:uncharacterized protein (DUF1697 family)
MPTYIALLRAVNVGGTGKLPMAAFRKLLEDLGYRNVETYIQSGNAVFDAPGPALKVIKALSAALEILVGSPIGLVLRTPDQLAQLIADNPYPAEARADGSRVFAVFLSAVPAPSAVPGLSRIPIRNERFRLGGDTLYLHLPDGPVDTKFQVKALDRLLAVTCTARNWNTVLKLHAMSHRG